MIFVTGATGLVGSHLVLSLLQKGLPVRALKRKTSNLDRVRKVFQWYTTEAGELFDRIEWVDGDLMDYFSLEDALRDVDMIYHCAAEVSFNRRKWKRIMQNNVEGTANLVNAALHNGVKRICHVSSIAALGNKKDGQVVTESSQWAPDGKQSVYAESKFRSEAEIWRGGEEGMDAVVVHPSVIIGPGSWTSGSGQFFDRIYKGLAFYTPGVTGYVDVRDVTDAMILLTEEQNFAQACNRKFLLNAENLEFREFMGMIAGSLKVPAPKYKAGYFLMHLARVFLGFISLISGREAYLNKDMIASALRRSYFDGSRISNLFGFRYRTITGAVQYTAECYLKDRKS